MDQTTQLIVDVTTEENQEASDTIEDAVFGYMTFTAASGAVILNGFNFVIMMVSKKMRHKRSLIFFAHQNFCDGITAAFIIIFYMIELTYGKIEGLSGLLFCYFAWTFFLPFVGLYAGIFNTVLMSVERFMAIVYPLKYKKISRKKIYYISTSFCWVLSVILNAPVFYGTELHQGKCRWKDTHEIRVLHSAYLLASVIVTFICPLILISILYVRMFVKLKRKKLTSAEDKTAHSSKEWTRRMYMAQMKLALLVVVIEVSGIVSWAPLNIYLILSTVGIDLSFSDYAVYVSSMMSVVNLIVNPIVFICMCEDFHVTVKDFFKCSGLKCCNETKNQRPKDG